MAPPLDTQDALARAQMRATAADLEPVHRRFLVVEDSPTVRLYLRHSLQALYPGCEVLEAGDGDAGLRLLCEQQYDGVMLDLQMPGLDGVEVLRSSHSSSWLPARSRRPSSRHCMPNRNSARPAPSCSSPALDQKA